MPDAAIREAGGLFMTGLPGLSLDDSSRELIHDHGINNFILFKQNCDTPEQITELTTAIREECVAAGLMPPLIGIDQEGGSVARLGPPFTRFPDLRESAESENPEKTVQGYARTCARELLKVGINLNFSPVLDVSPGGRGLFMERRSLGGDPETVARLGVLIIKTMQGNGLAACGKHFPGLGRAVPDPHITLPTIAADAAELADDLIPFAAAIRAGVAMIMTSHTMYPALDPDNQATVSKKILSHILRRELGFDRVIVTDDLEMGAVENETSAADAAGDAFTSGADLLLICHDHDKSRQAIALIARAAAEERKILQRIKESRRRIADIPRG